MLSSCCIQRSKTVDFRAESRSRPIEYTQGGARQFSGSKPSLHLHEDFFSHKKTAAFVSACVRDEIRIILARSGGFVTKHVGFVVVCLRTV